MNLPKIETPKYILEIPSTGKSIEYRPFLVKEEKILMIAQETEDEKQIMKAMQDVISACLFNAVDVETLTSFDIEFLFVRLRAKSVGEEVTVGIACSSCGEVHRTDINLEELHVTKTEPLPKTIMLTDTVGVVPRYISAKAMNSLAGIKDTSELLTLTIAAAIESIFDDDGVYPTDQTTTAELDAFIGSLNRTQIGQLESIIRNVPKLEKEITFDCKKCKTENHHTLSGAQSFFE